MFIKNWRKFTAVFLAAALAAVTASCVKVKSDSGGSAGSAVRDLTKESIKIAFVTMSTDGINVRLVSNAFSDALINNPNVKVDFKDGQFSVERQQEIIERCIADKYDCIILESTSAEGLNQIVREAESEGIPVITFNVGISATHTLHVQGEDYSTGFNAGKVLAAKLNYKGNVVLFDVPAEQKASSRTGTGFEDSIELYSGISIIESRNIAQWSPEVARSFMSDVLSRYPNPGDISALYCVSDEIAFGALQAIEQAGRAGEGIIIYGNMGYPDGIKAVLEGKFYATDFSDVYIEATATALYALYFISAGITSIKAGYAETPVISLPFTPVTLDNVTEIVEESRYKSLGIEFDLSPLLGAGTSR